MNRKFYLNFRLSAICKPINVIPRKKLNRNLYKNEYVYLVFKKTGSLQLLGTNIYSIQLMVRVFLATDCCSNKLYWIKWRNLASEWLVFGSKYIRLFIIGCFPISVDENHHQPNFPLNFYERRGWISLRNGSAKRICSSNDVRENSAKFVQPYFICRNFLSGYRLMYHTCVRRWNFVVVFFSP